MLTGVPYCFEVPAVPLTFRHRFVCFGNVCAQISAQNGIVVTYLVQRYIVWDQTRPNSYHSSPKMYNRLGTNITTKRPHLTYTAVVHRLASMRPKG